MSKKWLWGLGSAIFLMVVAGYLLCCLYTNNNTTYSDLQMLFADNANVEFVNMSPMRSELFPVVDRKNDWFWKIVLIGDDEVFYTSFASPKEAQDCYMVSKRQCKEDSLFLCGCDVIYYPGNNRDTLLILQQLLPDFFEQ